MEMDRSVFKSHSNLIVDTQYWQISESFWLLVFSHNGNTGFLIYERYIRMPGTQQVPPKSPSSKYCCIIIYHIVSLLFY